MVKMTFIISHDHAVPFLVSKSNQISSDLKINDMLFALQCDDTLVDVVGSQYNLVTLVRKNNVFEGTLDYDSSEWNYLPTNSFVGAENDPCVIYDSSNSSDDKFCCLQSSDCPAGFYCTDQNTCTIKSETIAYIIMASVGGIFIITIIIVAIILYKKRKANGATEIILTGNDLYKPFISYRTSSVVYN